RRQGRHAGGFGTQDACDCVVAGAPGRTRTSTMFPPPDFESGASTNSATGALGAGTIAAQSQGSTARGSGVQGPDRRFEAFGGDLMIGFNPGVTDERRSPEYVAAQVSQGGRRHLAAGNRKGDPRR